MAWSPALMNRICLAANELRFCYLRRKLRIGIWIRKPVSLNNYRSGDLVNAPTVRDLRADDGLALARLDDDGAPAAVIQRESGAGTQSAILAARPLPRIRLDPDLFRRGSVDGGWWPYSRNARAELPGLIAALKEQAGAWVQRVSVFQGEWDDIPHRLTGDQGHVVRVNWFTAMPRHTVSVSVAGRGPISLLVVPPGTPARAAGDVMDLAATNPGTAQAADILAAEEARPLP